MTSSRRAGPYIHALLSAYGVDTVFGIPGVHTIPLYEGLAESGLRHVTPRHEQGAGFMADGYARHSGRPGVCFVITGPGVTNILTPVAQAYADSIPMLVISSVGARRNMGQGHGHLHEMPDQQATVAPVTAFSHTLQSLAELPEVLARAFAVFEGGRPRPVHIEIPLDLWEEEPPELGVPARMRPARASAEPGLIEEAARHLAAAERPVILCGGGAVGAASDLRQLAERLGAPLVMTTNARGILAPDHPLAVPFSPSLDAVRALMAESDVALAVGTELGPTDYDMYETGMPHLPRPLIRVEVGPVQMVTNVVPDLPLTGHAQSVVAELLRALQPGEPGTGESRAEVCRTTAREAMDDRLTAGLRFLEVLREAAPEVPMVGDSTHPVYAGNLGYAAPAPGFWHNSSTGFGTLGYALPAATGAALARKGHVFCLVGDGGLHFTLGELAALKGLGAPVVVLVWNNECYGEIRDAMEAEGVTPEGVALASPEFARLAGAYGIPFARAGTVETLEAAVAEALGRDGPTMIEVPEAEILAACG